MSKSRNNQNWIGFDLGGTKMLSLLLDDNQKQIGRARTKTMGAEGAKAGVARIIETIKKSMAEGDVSAKRLGGIGIGCPGPLDLDRGVIINAPNLGWTDIAIKEQLEEEFKCPAAILNDVDAGIYGEYRFGAGKKGHCVLGVFPGTGIGGGCVYQGQVVRGKTGSCMEIGHIQVVPNGPLCGCSRRGCLEAVASRLAIAANAAMAAYRGEAPALYEIAGTDISKIRSGTLARSIKAGDEVIQRIVKRAATHVGTAVGNVVNLLAPDIVVLGGGLVEEMPALYVDAVTQSANKRVMPAFRDSFKILAAQLGDDATALGAAAWARHTVRADD